MNLDAQLFHWVNGDLGWDALEPFMKAASNFRLFIPLVLLAAGWMTLKDGLRGRVTVIALLVAVPLADQVSSHLLKPWIARPRPCRPEAGLIGVKTHGMHCSGRGGFPSSHAANTAAAFVLLAARYPATAVGGALVVAAVGWSRVYLGVHYPGDVAGGWILGGALGWLAVLGARRVEARLRARRRSSPSGP
jgi:undecaprenyl-diphosphatase